MALNFANNNSLSAISALPSSVSGGSMNLISTQTASGSANLSFTSGIDSTYKEYVFKYYNMHPATDDVFFQVNFRDGGSAFDATKTTTAFFAFHAEDDSAQDLSYKASRDLAQSTAYQPLSLDSIGNDNDQSCSGTLHLFDPSSTTFVKHFMARTNHIADFDYTFDNYVAGYCNVTTAIDGVDFKMSSGNIDSGVIKLYGIS
tara:strand:+ start:828 stop:1433 length:606 start_codon:yes stop_codon:yes gene_type:complete